MFDITNKNFLKNSKLYHEYKGKNKKKKNSYILVGNKWYEKIKKKKPMKRDKIWEKNIK